ncbi:MAG: hypothetical protein IT276_13600 [Ignavibacteriaceae bacterium]|nr:hypothetical protein [Ignavibacterium sp.]MCC6255946.1 hypothetical protein [Ignavibacteriaceae bacterium]HRN26829.1 hypothetical protein [Ignavibacteriaceae bacterium]HRP93227.1 hypothetical protein [Ignavibacteriaceae bacterium]HRQ54426.1 hypothetical protein [Ignavibacteriaceae bacterium]
MIEIKNIFSYRLVWLNAVFCLIFGFISFFYFEFAALLFVLLSNLFDILGYHFSLIRRTNQLPEKIIIHSYRINQFMYDVLLLIIIGIQFDWIAALAGWIMKLFGLQDVFYYLFLKEKLPLKWTWMKWTPLGFFKGDLSKNEIVTQAVIGILISVILLILR